MSWHRKGNEVTDFSHVKYNPSCKRGPPTRSRSAIAQPYGEVEDLYNNPRSTLFRNKSADLNAASPARSIPQRDGNSSPEPVRGSSDSDVDIDDEGVFWVGWTADVDNVLDMANSVRMGIHFYMNFGDKIDRLSKFLYRALKAERQDQSSSERQNENLIPFGLILHAHLDKLVKELDELYGAPRFRLAQQRQNDCLMARALRECWERRFKEKYYALDDIRIKRLYKASYLQGLYVDIDDPDSKDKFKTGWKLDESQHLEKLESFDVGQWWVNITFAHRDGILDSEEERATVIRHKACTIPLLSGEEKVINKYKTIYKIISPTKSPLTWQVLSQVGKEVRILRSHTLRSCISPIVGIRYDGVYKLSEYSHKLHEAAEGKREMYELKFTLERIYGQKSMDEVLHVPNMSQQDDWCLVQTIQREKIKATQGAAKAHDWQSKQDECRLELASNRRAAVDYMRYRAMVEAERYKSGVDQRRRSSEERRASLQEKKQVMEREKSKEGEREREKLVGEGGKLKLQIPQNSGTNRPAEVVMKDLDGTDETKDWEGAVENEGDGEEKGSGKNWKEVARAWGYQVD